MEKVTVKVRKSQEDLEKLSKEELIAKVKALEAHNIQLKNIINKANSSTEKPCIIKKPFDFTKYHSRHILLHFLYLGWDYQGFVVQEDTINTIEHHLFEALTKSCLIRDRSSSNYHRCGRTDKGVSSFGQVISITVRSRLTEETENNIKEEIQYCKILNKLLPNDILCIAWCPVKRDFSARFDCKSRLYKYFFPKGSLSIEAMKEAAQHLIGSHDFRNFCKMDVGNGVVEFVRNIEDVKVAPFKPTDCDNEYSMFYVQIKGNAFLWHQIRCIMAVLLLIGQGRESPHVVSELLDVEKNPRKPEYHMASEIPLNLFFCEYDGIEWIYEDDSLNMVIEKLNQSWTFLSTKQTMIKAMIDELRQEKGNRNCLSTFLIPDFKRKYINLLGRQKCESLESKIKHFAKRKRLEVENKT